MSKLYKVGLYVGRFQPFHLGHLNVIKHGLAMCEKLIVVVGSAQESRTKKNPYTFEERADLIYGSVKDLVGKSALIIIPVNDRENYGDNEGWGEYLLKQVKSQTGFEPDLMIGGYEVVRGAWFDDTKLDQLIIRRSPISATQVRNTKNLKELSKLVPTYVFNKITK